MYGYILTDYSQLKNTYPEFRNCMQKLREDLIRKSAQDWGGSQGPKAFGGMKPTGGQFGISTVMPELFNDMSGTRLVTWNQRLTSTGHQTIMAGAATGNTIAEDYKVGMIGLAFLSKAQRVTEVKLQISDRKIARINVEELMAYEQPCLVLEEGWILDEETGFDLYAYVEALGYQRIKLIGLQSNRVPNKLQVTNTGAALT